MIRTADINDPERLTELFTELHRYHVEIKPENFTMPDHGWFKDRIREIFSDCEQTVFVYESEGEINGYAVVKIKDIRSEEVISRRLCYIDCLAVSENKRRKGIGTKLFAAVKEYGSQNGCTHMQLGVTACNTNAVGFYEKMGLIPRTIIMEEKL